MHGFPRAIEPARYVLHTTRCLDIPPPMTLIATKEPSLHAVPRAANVPPPPANTGARTLGERSRRSTTTAARSRCAAWRWRRSARRGRRLARSGAALATADAGAAGARGRRAARPARQRAGDRAPIQRAAALHVARHAGIAVARDRRTARRRPARPAPHCLFGAPDVARLQQALFDGDAVTLIAHLRRADGRSLRCSVHLSALDPADPDWRWACIVRLPQTPNTSHPHERHLPPMSNQRPRLDARPASSV